MAAENFRQALSYVLAHEGGYVNHPADPGGATNQGITQAVYNAYLKTIGAKPQSVRFIGPSEVAAIYQKQYWKLIRGDSLPSGLDYAVFDFAVNSGVSRAIRYLQKQVRVADDGIIGMITINAVQKEYDQGYAAMICQYCANRLAFVKSLPTFKVFGKGWTRRIVGEQAGFQIDDKGVLDLAIMMASKSFNSQLPKQLEVSAKAIGPDMPTIELPQALGNCIEEVRNLV